MANQSLDKWLHGKRRSPASGLGVANHTVLDWPTRLQIAIGTAQGLYYMHHDCSPLIILRDVKSAIAGSFGYMAPEYSYTTKINEKTDVYSFGVVLLELTTGREPNCGDEHTGLAEWARREYSEGKTITDALDGQITKPCYLEEMATVLKLGLISTSTLPSTRPSMKFCTFFSAMVRRMVLKWDRWEVTLMFLPSSALPPAFPVTNAVKRWTIA